MPSGRTTPSTTRSRPSSRSWTQRGPRWVQLLDDGLDLVVDGVVLPDGMNVREGGVGGNPGWVVVGDPHQHRGAVAQQLDHLRYLVANHRLEEAALLGRRVVGV